MDILVEGFQIRQQSAHICKYACGMLFGPLAHGSVPLVKLRFWHNLLRLQKHALYSTIPPC